MTYEIDKISSLYFDAQEELFLQHFNRGWDKLISAFPYPHPQFQMGNRIRPRLVFWGYCAKMEMDNEQQFQFAVQIAIVIELIHKTSIILDDYIDGDCARRGVESFHITYGPEKTVIFALNLIGRAINQINNLLTKSIVKTEPYIFLMNKFSSTMLNMTEGVLQELDLTAQQSIDKQAIRQIIDKETSQLLSASILFGYSAAGGKNPSVLGLLERIGYDCGYIFQVMNDMEAWCQAGKNSQYKGNLNIDVDRHRKNIVMCFLYETASGEDKNVIANLHGASKSEYLLHLFETYKVADYMLEEVDILFKHICENIAQLESQCRQGWSETFTRFISKVYALCQQRIGIKA